MFRTINQRDPVPHLPPTLLGFAHSPQEVWFAHNDTSYMMCSPVDGEDPNCSDSYHLDYSVIVSFYFEFVKRLILVGSFGLFRIL